jgi:hypothetical protein
VADARPLNPKRFARLKNLLAAFALAISPTGCGPAKKSVERAPDTIANQSARNEALINSAHAVGIIARCYRSPQSVLFGPPTSTGQQGRPPGWVVLEGFPDSERGEAELRDSDGKTMRAGWLRQPSDTVTVLASNDFVRIEIRFLVSKGNLAGHGTAHSDAALEPDSTGRLSDLRRSWEFSATEAPCVSTQ